VTVSGGGSPQISVSPSSLSFGSVAVGQSKSMTLSIKNGGTAALTISSLSSDNKAFSACDSVGNCCRRIEYAVRRSIYAGDRDYSVRYVDVSQ